MISADIRAPDLDRLIANLGATEEVAKKALHSTMGKMAAWLRSRSVKGLSAELRVQQKILRRRLKTYRMQGSLSETRHFGEVKVWYGLNPIPLIELGARQTSTGVWVQGDRFVPHAFIAVVHGKRRVMLREGKGRLPIAEQRADLYDKSVTYIEDRLIGTLEFEEKFLKLFEHELKWRTSIPA